MTDTTLLALFEDIDPASNAIERLREMGIADSQISVISGVPIMHKMLGRPHPWTNVSRLALGGAFGRPDVAASAYRSHMLILGSL